MLADSAEARTRAEGPESDDDLRNIVRSIIERVQKDGQLDNTQLTLRDLNLIADSSVTTLPAPIIRAFNIPPPNFPPRRPMLHSKRRKYDPYRI